MSCVAMRRGKGGDGGDGGGGGGAGTVEIKLFFGYGCTGYLDALIGGGLYRHQEIEACGRRTPPKAPKLAHDQSSTLVLAFECTSQVQFGGGTRALLRFSSGHTLFVMFREDNPDSHLLRERAQTDKRLSPYDSGALINPIIFRFGGEEWTDENRVYLVHTFEGQNLM